MDMPHVWHRNEVSYVHCWSNWLLGGTNVESRDFAYCCLGKSLYRYYWTQNAEELEGELELESLQKTEYFVHLYRVAQSRVFSVSLAGHLMW